MINAYLIHYNRPSFLRQQIAALRQYDYLNIVVVDNASTFPPAVQYLEELRQAGVSVITMDRNYGHRVVWSQNISKVYSENQRYIVSDCDCIPHAPEAWFDLMNRGLDENPRIMKIGLHLNTNWIPYTNKLRDQIIRHENKLMVGQPGAITGTRVINNTLFIEKPVDTTFALYREGFHEYTIFKALRMKPPYQVKHLTWFQSAEDEQTEEAVFYRAECEKNHKSNHWSKYKMT